MKELPRILILYDVNMPLEDARKAVKFHFRRYADIQDDWYDFRAYFFNMTRAKSLLLAKGYMELEETLMQWKQKSHLLRLLEPTELSNADFSKGLSAIKTFTSSAGNAELTAML